MGSGELVRSLDAVGLVDRWLLFIPSLVLGSGRRLFVDAGHVARLRLLRSVATSTGIVIATYASS